MRARLILDRILNELESGNADSIEGKVIGAASIAHRERVHAQIFERLHPCFEDRLHRGISLHVDTANLSGAVVDIELNRNLCLLRLPRHRPSFAPTQARRALLQPGKRRTRSEMMDDVPLRAEQSFLFTAP